MKLIRFIGEMEYNNLVSNDEVVPINTGRAWSGKKRLFAFPLDHYSLDDYKLVKEYLEIAYDIEYSYMLTLDFKGYAYETFAAYDVEMIHMTLGVSLSFDIDEDAYDSGSVYIIPEVRLDGYTINDVIDVDVL